MKTKLFGLGFQTNGLALPGVPLTLSMLRLNNVPDPFNGVRLEEKAEMRRVLIVPGPVLRIPPETFQLLAVSPAAWTNDGDEKLTTAESKVKSPWKPM